MKRQEVDLPPSNPSPMASTPNKARVVVVELGPQFPPLVD